MEVTLEKTQEDRSWGWQDAVKIIVALSASGFAFTLAENWDGFLSLAAMLVVWGGGFLAKQYGWKPNKVHLTCFLFVVSVILTLLFQPVAIPAFPVWNGDLALYVSALLTWAAAIVSLGKQVFIWATANYNILLEKILKKIEPAAQIVEIEA